MDNIRRIIVEHYHKYPLMTINDYVKLVYQSTLGPHHFASAPSLEKIIQGIKKELMVGDCQSEDYFTDIGNGYFRVDLGVIDHNIMTLEDLGEVFLLSIEKTPTKTDLSRYKSNLTLLLNLIRDGVIPIDFLEAQAFISVFDLNSPEPIGHSDRFKHAYNPHYRVVMKELLKGIVNIIPN